MAVTRCCKDITWESLAPVYENSNFFKIDLDVAKGDSWNGSKTTTALEKNEIDDIHVVGNISDGFDEILMNYFPRKTKRASCRELLNKLKSLSDNPNVPEEWRVFWWLGNTTRGNGGVTCKERTGWPWSCCRRKQHSLSKKWKKNYLCP